MPAAGLGRLLRLAWLRMGANLVLAARTQGPLDELVNHLKDKYGIHAIGVPTDVAN